MTLPTFIRALDNRIPLRLKAGELAIGSTSYTETDTPHHIELGPAAIHLSGQEAIDVGTALIQAEHHRRAVLAQFQASSDTGEPDPAPEVDAVSVLDQVIERETDAGQATVAQVAAREAVAELIAADVAYDLARGALEEYYRQVAEKGYLVARMFDARALSEAFVRADCRRSRALLKLAPLRRDAGEAGAA